MPGFDVFHVCPKSLNIRARFRLVCGLSLSLSLSLMRLCCTVPLLNRSCCDKWIHDWCIMKAYFVVWDYFKCILPLARRKSAWGHELQRWRKKKAYSKYYFNDLNCQKNKAESRQFLYIQDLDSRKSEVTKVKKAMYWLGGNWGHIWTKSPPPPPPMDCYAMEWHWG